MIVLDTSLLSLAYRRRRGDAEPPPEVVELARLIRDDAPTAIPGIVLQELLSGVRTEAQADELRRRLEGFFLLLAGREDHETAARIVNQCRAKGVASATVDALIAAQTLRADGELFTMDQDYQRMVPYCGLKLYRCP